VKVPLLSSVHTTRVHGPSTVFTGRVYVPWTRASCT